MLAMVKTGDLALVICHKSVMKLLKIKELVAIEPPITFAKLSNDPRSFTAFDHCVYEGMCPPARVSGG
jgi:hypothetical protein